MNQEGGCYTFYPDVTLYFKVNLWLGSKTEEMFVQSKQTKHKSVVTGFTVMLLSAVWVQGKLSVLMLLKDFACNQFHAECILSLLFYTADAYYNPIHSTCILVSAFNLYPSGEIYRGDRTYDADVSEANIHSVILAHSRI